MPLSGIVFIALIVSSFFIGNTPASNASASTVLAYYRTHKTESNVTALLIGLGIIAGLFFFGYLREYLRQDHASRWLASIAFGGAVVFALGGAISAGAFLALGDAPQVLTPSTAQTMNLVQADLTNSLMQVGLAVFYLATAVVILRSRLLPAWLGWVSAVLGLVAASLIVAFIAFLATGLWVIAVAIMLWIHPVREQAEQEDAPRRPQPVG
jgi:hypothetical protein